MWCLALAFICVAVRPVIAQNDHVAWLRQHSIPVSLTASEHDFRDLEPLVATLSGVRIVQLGELTHGDGTGSAARVRLVRFLHERLGFNVLVWEAGLYECHVMDELLSHARWPTGIAAECLWPFWAESAGIAPLFDYVMSTRMSSARLQMAGFDLQFTGQTLPRRLDDLRSWFERAGTPLPPDLQGITPRSASTSLRDTVLSRARAFASHFEQNAAVIRRTHGMREASRIERVIRNMVEYQDMLADRDRSHAGGPEGLQAFVRSYNRRERVNAENLLWLANEYYGGEKLIVWLHNVHAANTRMAADFHALAGLDTAASLESSGRLVKAELGHAVYSVATIAYEGMWGFPGWRPEPINAAPSESLEAWLRASGAPVAFLDLRQARQAGHWLSQPTVGNISAQVRGARYPIAWPAVFDGVLFIREMAPATALR